MYVHNLYSNMIDKFNRHTSISWSFFMQNNNGNLVVVKSGPHINTDKISTMLTDDDDDMFEDGKKSLFHKDEYFVSSVTSIKERARVSRKINAKRIHNVFIVHFMLVGPFLTFCDI